ncbi:hypothetical protein MKEN_01122400 [Mycena kentingensis (nom. inval.)]|nr:hypothetical protein MKEN_01122400 [Mycena kentingensis (nom. inval.)]
MPDIAPPSPPFVAEYNAQSHYEANQSAISLALYKLLGLEYSIDLDAETLWPIAERNGTEPNCFGPLLSRHAEAFIRALQGYLDIYKDDGKYCFNAVVGNRQIVLALNPLGASGDPISGAVYDGTYLIYLQPLWFGRPGSDPSRHFTPGVIRRSIDPAQIAAGLLNGLSLRAKLAVDTHYDATRAESLRGELSAVLGQEMAWDPNWAQVYAALNPSINERVERTAQHLIVHFQALVAQLRLQLEQRAPEVATPILALARAAASSQVLIFRIVTWNTLRAATLTIAEVIDLEFGGVPAQGMGAYLLAMFERSTPVV